MLRYTCGVQALPATVWHSNWVRTGHWAVAVRATAAPPSAAAARTLAIALSHATSPGRTLAPLAVSRTSSTGAHHATATA